MFRHIITVTFILLIGSTYLMSNSHFYLKIDLLNRETSKDSNSQRYIVEIKNRDFYIRINAGSFKDNFFNYLLMDEKRKRKKLSERIGLSLELKTQSQLSKLFSEKQKEIIMKKLMGEKLTKTEREYFSRTIKPKLEAILNPEIQRIGALLI